MILPLRTRTEFSGKAGFASVKELVALAKREGNSSLAITDFNTLGHVAFEKECADAHITPIFGLEVDRHVYLAKNQKGLRDLYAGELGSGNILDLHLHPGRIARVVDGEHDLAVGDPFYLNEQQRLAYEVHNPREPYCPGHGHLKANLSIESHRRALELADTFPRLELPKGSAPPVSSDFNLEAICLDGASIIGLEMNDVYHERLARELSVIESKGFVGYFEMVSDLVGWAKEQQIFMGPGRGSAGGSLVAYLLGITEVDPIRYGLLFERFLDPTRSDLPDIDLDWPDDRRDEAFTWLRNRYGQARVARLATALRYGGKSALREGCKALGLRWTDSLDRLGECIYVPLAGEVKTDCLMDVFKTEAAAPFLKAHPEAMICAQLEGRVKTTGQHAAGVVVATEELNNYCSVKDGVAQLDMHDAEDLGLVKLDCLGLRTMAVLAHACRLLGRGYQWLLDIPLDDEKALQELQQGNYAGIFQWEGSTLRGLTDRTPPADFEDMVLLTSIARPGPLQAGMGKDFEKVQAGTYMGPGVMWGNILDNSRGILAYQEQVMALLYKLGFDDATVCLLRKAMGKSKVDVLAEYADQFKTKAHEKGFTEAQAHSCWEQIKGVGAYLFNRSHAVAYTMVSFWCAYLKAHHPMEFFTASMEKSPSVEAGAEMLREMTKKRIPHVVLDPERSGEEWSIQHGSIVGALTVIPGIGSGMASQLVKRRAAGSLTDLQKKKLSAGITIYSVSQQDAALVEQARASPSVPTVSMPSCKLGGGWILAYCESRFLIDYSSPKMVKKYGPSSPGRDKAVALTLCDEENTIACSLSGRSYNGLAEDLEAIPDKIWCYWNLSRWAKNGKLYLNDVRLLG